MDVPEIPLSYKRTGARKIVTPIAFTMPAIKSIKKHPGFNCFQSFFFNMYSPFINIFYKRFFYCNTITFYVKELLFFLLSPFISSTKEILFAVSSTHAGRNPLFTALRTDFIFDHAAQ